MGVAECLPAGKRDREPFGQLRPALRQRGHRLVVGGKQAPPAQAIALGERQQGARLLGRRPGGGGAGPPHVPRQAGHRILTGPTQHPRRDAPATEAARDPQRPEIGAQDERPRGHRAGSDGPTVAMTDVPARTRSPSATNTDRSRRVGSTTSTCDPRRMIPIRSPSATGWPSPT